MITLYTWKTPNGRKPAILLEELGMPYRVQPIDIGADAQFDPAFLRIAPNNKIPALVDRADDGSEQTLFESGAILTYLARLGGRFLAPDGPAHWATLEWLYWSVGGIGPMLGQLSFFAMRSDTKVPLAIERFTREAKRLLGVMERRLGEAPHLAGDDYSIADIATYPWVHAANTVMSPVLEDTFAASPAIRNWMARLAARPAVAKGMRILEP